MASSTRRVNSKTKYNGQMYVEGTAVRKLATQPARKEPRTRRVPTVSTKARANRQKATQMNLGYVLFLTITAVATLFLCVQFVQLKAQLTTQATNLEQKEAELSVLKADNDAFYNSVAASGDLEYIKEVATKELGMKYPAEGQVIYFDTSGNGYVRQYQDVPEAK